MPQLQQEQRPSITGLQSSAPVDSERTIRESATGGHGPRPFETAERPGAALDVANSLAGLVHDVRNMVAAMDLYCDLLAEPEVLSEQCRHYAADLRLVSGAGRRLLDKLAVAAAQTAIPRAFALEMATDQPGEDIASTADPCATDPVADRPLAGSRRDGERTSSRSAAPLRRAVPTPVWPAGFRPTFPVDGEAAGTERARVERVCEELRRILPLLSAIAGLGVSIELSEGAQDWPLPLNSEDLTRVMVNLVRNASEAMAGSGRLQIAVEENAGFVVLSVADEGPGIPRELMERIFQSGFSTRDSRESSRGADEDAEQCSAIMWPVRHRGLGLSIVRSIVSAARGTVWAANRSATQPATPSTAAGDAVDAARTGAVFFLEFPLLQRSLSHGRRWN